jgi:chromosomal replication initiation ATPase DnaA
MVIRKRASTQLPLDLGHRAALRRRDFVVAPCNEHALMWIDRWPDWPVTGLALYGSPGCGKTHLAEIWRAQSGAEYLDASALDNCEANEIVGNAANLVVENIHCDVTQRTLLHVYNMIGERGGHILFTAQEPPSRMAFDLPDLKSRLRALPTVAIADPDDFALAGVLRKMFEDRQLSVGEDVIVYLLSRMERSFAAARAVVVDIDRLALAERRQVTVHLARIVLAARDEG